MTIGMDKDGGSRARLSALSLLPLLLLTIPAHAQPLAAPDRSTSSRPVGDGSAVPAAAAYCPDLQRVTMLALTKDRFGPITGKPRDGDFLDTTLWLAGWKDCALYGPRMYTCDSHELGTAEAAERAQATVMQDIGACLGGAWSEDKERSSAAYGILHNAEWPLAMTISTDQVDQRTYVIRLILFLRTSGTRP